MIQWDVSPEAMAAKLDSLKELLESRVGNALFDIEREAEGQMRLNRPWRDITGNARRGLRVDTRKEGGGFTMYFIHSVEYGQHLELARGGRYAVVMPTLQETAARIRRELTGVL